MVTGPSIFNHSQNLIPIFEGDSYDYWSIQMKTLFMSHDLWEIVEKGYTAPANEEELARLTANQLRKYKRDKKKDARALLFIQQGVSKTIFPRIVNAVTSKEAWEILKTEFQGSERIINNQEIRDFELMDSLYSAAADGEISKFEDHSNHLEQILTPNGNTILHIHITARRKHSSRISQNMNFVREILGKCPDLLWKANKKGETLLHMAARHGHADVANDLLEECKKPYQIDQERAIKARQMLEMINEARDTALHEAVRYNHIDVVQLLIEEDVELPYDVNTAGETPLYLAAERGYAGILKKILDTCISPADHGPNSRTALHATVIRNDIGMTALLLDKGSIQKHDKKGWTPLHLAAAYANVEILKKLLNKDRSVAYKVDNNGGTALHYAANYGRVDIMQELISICPGCSELVDNKGQNVLHYATKSKNRNAVRLVLRNPSFGNLINEKDKKGNTPFLKAISMLSIINHPKVDRLVFNNDNDNAVNILHAKDDSPTPWKWHEIIRWFLIGEEIARGQRFMSNDVNGEGKENKINPAVSSKSNDGDENGNGRSSRDDAEKNARQNNELVVATLIATVTFAAGLTMPGGFISEKGLDQGAAILTRNTAFKVFVLLNSMSMFLSSLAVFTHLLGWHNLEEHNIWSTKIRFRRFLIVFAMLAMIGAFLSGTCAVLYRDRNLAISACVVPVAVLAFLALVNLTENFLYWFLGLTNRKSLYNLVCVLDELWYEIGQGGFKNLIRNKVRCK